MNAHPLADRIPRMSEGEFLKLKASIKEVGQEEPITIYEGQILDGRHRYRACLDLGVEPLTRQYEGDTPVRFVVNHNAAEWRELKPGQLAAIAVEFLPDLEEEAKGRIREGAARGGSASPGSGEPPLAPKPDAHRARNDAGALVGVSGATVDRARRIKEKAPDLFEKVAAGEMAVRAADDQVRERESVDRPPAGPKAAEPKTKRQQQVANKQRLRLETAVGTCQGLAHGLPLLKVSEAASVSTDEEIRGWIGAFSEAIRSIRQLRKQLEDNR